MVPIEHQLLLFTSKLEDLDFIPEVCQLYQDGSWAESLLLTDSGIMMSPLKNRRRREVVLAQGLQNEMGHKHQHVAAFRRLRHPDETEITGPALIL